MPSEARYEGNDLSGRIFHVEFFDGWSLASHSRADPVGEAPNPFAFGGFRRGRGLFGFDADPLSAAAPSADFGNGHVRADGALGLWKKEPEANRKTGSLCLSGGALFGRSLGMDLLLQLLRKRGAPDPHQIFYIVISKSLFIKYLTFLMPHPNTFPQCYTNYLYIRLIS